MTGPRLFCLIDCRQTGNNGQGPGSEAIDRFHSAGRSSAAKNTSGDRIFLYVTPQDANSPVDLQIGSQRLLLTRDEFASLLQSPHAPSQLDKGFDFGGATKPTVVVSGDDNSATAVAGLLEARYGRSADVFLARDAYAASEHLAALPSLSVRSPSDLVVYTAKNITDYGTIANLKKNLARARIRVVEEKGGSVSERWQALSREQWSASNVMVIAGHRDSTMASHLMDLKEAGALKGKLVVAASCYEPGVELLQSDLTAGYQGAAGVIFFRETIKASAVEAVMLEFTRLMRSESFAPARIDDLLGRSVDRALELAETPSEREEIEKLRHPIFQLTRLRVPRTPSDADG